jgi:hypothetical protein
MAAATSRLSRKLFSQSLEISRIGPQIVNAVSMLVDVAVYQKIVELETRKTQQSRGLGTREHTRTVTLNGERFQPSRAGSACWLRSSGSWTLICTDSRIPELQCP